jgi:hypothetical protein
MLSKSLPHIIVNKWTFIDLMSNLMAICATWRIWSWSSIHIMNSFTPIPWNSSNYASILLIKSKFTIFTFTATITPFATIGYAIGKTTISYIVINIGSTPLRPSMVKWTKKYIWLNPNF